MNENEIDPLDKLFVKSGTVNKALLGDILVKYLRIDEKGNIFPLSTFYSETNKNKIIIVLLAKKATSLKLGNDEAIAPKDLSKLLDMPDGSLRPTLRQLVDERIAEEKESLYNIFPHAVERCAEILKKEIQEKTTEPQAKKSVNGKISMREAIMELISKGELDELKTAGEIYNLVKTRRPGTTYAALYKVILDLLQQRKLNRELKQSAWYYKRAS
ncbi:MAG: hypothetical protein NTY48_06320 [Candidatus Diapherotrites archaeon]|nr:hypothetical protein [Candidatus Diapherotrites archaeon]